MLNNRVNCKEAVASNWKGIPWRSPKYMKWISGLDCCVSDAPGPSDPHHVKIKGHAGMATKVGDDRCLPLSHRLHLEVERGEGAFWERWGRDPEELIAFYNSEWVRLGRKIG